MVGVDFCVSLFPSSSAFFFWNPWMRRLFGLGYIGFAFTWVPFLRRVLFTPFRETLLADADLKAFDLHSYFSCTRRWRKKERGFPSPSKKRSPRSKGNWCLKESQGWGKLCSFGIGFDEVLGFACICLQINVLAASWRPSKISFRAWPRITLFEESHFLRCS